VALNFDIQLSSVVDGGSHIQAIGFAVVPCFANVCVAQSKAFNYGITFEQRVQKRDEQRLFAFHTKDILENKVDLRA
jgi:hypothetical protein